MLTSPTVAVDEQRVVLIMPVGAILLVTSDISFEKRMIEVTWEKRKLAMFGSDLLERGLDFSTPRLYVLDGSFAHGVRLRAGD